MLSKVKLIVLVILILTLSYLIFAFIQIKEVESELFDDKKDSSAIIEDYDIPEISINATLNSSLSVYNFKDDIINYSVKAAQQTYKQTNTDAKKIKGITISDISLVNTGTAGIFDTIYMFNVELSLLLGDDTEEINKTNYILFYSRWNETNSVEYISSITDEDILVKYYHLSSNYGNNVYITACFEERNKYLKGLPLYTKEELTQSAYGKALNYDDLVVLDGYSVDDSLGDMIIYTFNSNEGRKVSLCYMQIEEFWSFIGANMN